MKRTVIQCFRWSAVWIVFFLIIVAATAAETTSSSRAVRSEQNEWASLTTGAQVYQAACATCHGPHGRGSSPPIVGFEIPLPDFTDCSFASREPHADWFAVAHNGGPTRAFDPMMPAFGSAISDHQIELAATHVKSFCQDTAWPAGEFNLPRPLTTGKAYLEDEFVWELQSTTEKPVSMQMKFVAETRVGSRGQLELAVPVGVQQLESVNDDGTTDLVWGEGLGDVALGFKTALWSSLPAGNICSLGAEVFLPLGDEKDGFSQGIFRFEPFIAMGQILPGDNFIQIHGGAELSTDDEIASHELFWRAAVGHTFTEGRFGRAWSPMVEIIGAYKVESDSSPEWSVAPELHLTLSQRQHVMLNLGVMIPITDFDDRQIEVMTHLLWDWFDGGFTEGW